MMTAIAYEPKGVIPACLLPLHPDLSIDETSYRKHLRDVAAVPGLSAITVNAHASEVASCTFEEQERILAITMDEVGDRVPVVNGVYADGSLEAARSWAAETGARFLVLAQDAHSQSKRYEVFATPFAFVIDDQGTVASKGLARNADHLRYVLAGVGNGRHPREPRGAS